jgi:hypothetical protein
MIANARLVRTGLNLQQWVTAEGGVPSDLRALGDEIPSDPFTAKPLIYRTTPSGFILYSVGPNRVDDGGKNSRQNRHDDLVWEAEF